MKFLVLDNCEKAVVCIFLQIKDVKIEGSALKAALINEVGEKPFLEEIINECQSTVNSDRCELASQFNECVHKGLAAHHDTNTPKKP